MMQKQAERQCATCAYHDAYTWVCFNGESENRADITMRDHSCECYSPKPTGKWTIKMESSKTFTVDKLETDNYLAFLRQNSFIQKAKKEVQNGRNNEESRRSRRKQS